MQLSDTMEALPEGWSLAEVGEGFALGRYRTSEGSINLSCYELAEGIILTDIDLACPTLPAFNPSGTRVATVNWCALGRCEVDFGNRGSFVVGEGTLCVSSATARLEACGILFGEALGLEVVGTVALQKKEEVLLLHEEGLPVADAIDTHRQLVPPAEAVLPVQHVMHGQALPAESPKVAVRLGREAIAIGIARTVATIVGVDDEDLLAVVDKRAVLAKPEGVLASASRAACNGIQVVEVKCADLLCDGVAGGCLLCLHLGQELAHLVI